jgi:hypothetical protein
MDNRRIASETANNRRRSLWFTLASMATIWTLDPRPADECDPDARLLQRVQWPGGMKQLLSGLNRDESNDTTRLPRVTNHTSRRCWCQVRQKGHSRAGAANPPRPAHLFQPISMTPPIRARKQTIPQASPVSPVTSHPVPAPGGGGCALGPRLPPTGKYAIMRRRGLERHDANVQAT